MAYRVAHDGAVLDIPAGALSADTTLSITPLAAGAMAPVDQGIKNTTPGPRAGYRMGPPGQRFASPITITLPYDPASLPDGQSDAGLNILWFDTAALRWTALKRVGIDRRNQTVTARTDHFTDFITGTVVVPEHPQVESFNPTRIADLKAADPGAKINLIEPPRGNSTGDARLSYPIEVPAGRNGLQPHLAIQYDSARANGWLGIGWDIAIPSIEIDTRWGVPRYDTGQIDGTPNGLETETYLLNGEQLTPVAHRGPLVQRTAEKRFSLRVEGQFQKIVRHGNSPSTYVWEVTAKDGTRHLYGGDLASGVDRATVLSDPAVPNGNIGRWMLREVIDTNGNSIRYRYDVVTVTQNGPEPARQIYPRSIRYTGRVGSDGPYEVTFTRSSGRPDPIVEGRLGFKTVMADRLTGMDVRLVTESNPLIRRYRLDYRTGQFSKSLLIQFTQFGEDGTEFNAHELDYFDDVGTPAPDSLSGFGPSVAVPGGGVTHGSGLVAGIDGTAFSGEANGTNLTHLYTGIALVIARKEASAGFKAGSEGGDAKLSQTLVDLNGDGRLDQVFETDGSVFWRPNTGSLTAPEFGPARLVAGLGAFNRSNTRTFTAGAQAFIGPAAGIADVQRSRTSESIYFSDINGDGLPDLVSGGTVLFNRLDANGQPSFSPESPTPLGSGAPSNTSGLITVTPEEQAEAEAAFHLDDSLRRWVAPFTGSIDITGQVALAQTGDAAADGVRAAIQLEGTEIFSLVIADPTDLTPKPITGLTDLPITAGQRLYFRVNSRNDGAFDTVSFDPTITYRTVDGVAVDPATLDENGLPVFATTASADYAYGGRALPVTVPVNGTATLTGTISKPIPTSDEVRFVIRLNGTVVFQSVFAANETGSVPVSLPAPLTLAQGDQLLARMEVDTRINLAGLRFAPTLAYETVDGAPAPIAPDGTRALRLDLPATAQIYPVSAVSPFAPWVSPGGTFEITQIVAGSAPAGFNGRITLAAKSGGSILAKQPIDIANGLIVGPDRLSAVLSLAAGQVVFFTAEATNPGTLGAFSVGAPTTAGGEVLPFDVRLAASDTEPFGGGYRNWWFGDYNGSDATGPIDQSVLRLPLSETDQVFRQFIGMLPFPTEDRWRARDTNTFVSGGLMGATRLGARTLEFTDGTGFGGARGIIKTLGARNVARNISVLVFGLGRSDGTSFTDIDFLDFNGDGYPDVVGAGSLQATLPNGALEGRRIDVGAFAKVRQAEVVSINKNLGATTSSLRSAANLFGLNIASEMAPFNVGAGISASEGTTTTQWDLLDINGDGLPDFVQRSDSGLMVQLNLGYRFGAPELWGGTGTLRFERTEASGFDGQAGFTLPAYSFGGGISSTRNRSGTQSDLLDVNGDGLPDLVVKALDNDITSVSTSVQVSFNTGAGFLPAQSYTGALPRPIQSRTGVHRNAGAHFTVSFGTGVALIINPGFNRGDSFGGSDSQLRDFDGDGYVDHIASDGALVNVNLNRHGRTNLLKDIRRPLGATIALDYVRAGNTPDHPQRRWVLASTRVFDGLAGDGADYQIVTFAYEQGRWDRAERTFYGFRTVREQHRDTSGVTTANIGTTTPTALPIYRSIVQTFRTDSFYTKALLERQVTQDGANARFLETVQAYDVVTVPNNTAIAGLEDFTATRFPQLVRRDRLFYEGQPAAAKQAAETFAYDAFGNVSVYGDLADTGSGDDVNATVRYTAEDPACQTNYIVGIPDRIRVTDAGGAELRRREATVNCTTGNLTQVRSFLADGSAAVTDMVYDGEGKRIRVVGPANLNGQRTTLDYVYDTVVSAHIESVTDQFLYRSTASHNFKFGEIVTATDSNGQRVTKTYDRFGRLATVVGPYEQGTGRTTIDFTYNPLAPVPWALTRHVDTFRSATDRIETALFTDGLKRVVQTKKDGAVSPAAGTAPTDVMVVTGRVTFDAFGRTIEQFYPLTEPLGQAGTFNPTFDAVQPTRSAFDILDRITEVRIPDNTTTRKAYDFGADRAGRTQFRATVTDARNIRKETYREVRGLVTTASEFNNGGAIVQRTSYAYDPMRQVVSATDDRNNVTRVEYDLFGRRTAIDNPDTGRTVLAYDLADNLVAKETANLRAISQRITYVYEFNRLKEIRYPVFPANNVTYTYGAATLLGQPGNLVGRITRITDAAGTEDRQYGPLGEIVFEQRTIPVQGGQVPTYVTRYEFDTWNRLQRMTYPDGELLTYAYDSGGLLRAASGNDSAINEVYAGRIDYDKFGQRLLIDIGNGTRTTYTYDPLNRRLANAQATLAIGYRFHDLAFGYDAVGNLTSLENRALPPGTFPGPGLGNAIGGPWLKSYAYDDLYRLTSSTGRHATTPDAANTYTFSQTYDTIHNITRKTQRNEFKSSVQPQTTYDYAYTYPAAGTTRPHGPTAIGSFDITHDPNGNHIRTQERGTSNVSQYLFDEENRLACFNKGAQAPSPSCDAQGMTEFVYDHAGVRKRKDASTPTLYPNQYFTDFGGGSGNQFKHVFIGEIRLLSKKARPAPDRQHWYFHPDYLGSTSIVTNENGQLAEHIHYFPYGEVWLNELPNSAPVPYLFSAKELDPETSFYDFGARYLDPRFSKWMSTDPALGRYLSGEAAGGLTAPVNFALYTYGRNSPMVYADPNGALVFLIPVAIALAKATAIGAGTGAAIGASVYVGRQYYVDRSFENVTASGVLTSAGVGAGFGAGTVLAPATTTVIGLGMTGVAAVDLAERAGRYSELTTEEQRAVHFDTATLAFGLRSFRRGDCSFTDVTPVSTPDGLRAIGELKIGDRVLARNEVTGAYSFKPITKVFRHQEQMKVRLTLEDPATGQTDVVETTTEHPFHVPGQGFVAAASLKPGDPVSRALSADPLGTFSVVRLAADLSDTFGALRVKTLTLEDEAFWAYNLAVADDHTYHVGQSRGWVHNACPHQVVQNRQSGRKFQEAVTAALGAEENTAVISVTLPNGAVVRTIPDLWARSAGGMVEIKDVLQLSLRPQLEAQIISASRAGEPYNLVVSMRTHTLSQPLRDAIRESGGKIYRFDPASGALTPY
jgi:RHS repeat-associated protein